MEMLDIKVGEVAKTLVGIISFGHFEIQTSIILLDPDTMSMDRISEIRCHLQRKVLKDTVKTLKDKVVENH